MKRRERRRRSGNRGERQAVRRQLGLLVALLTYPGRWYMPRPLPQERQEPVSPHPQFLGWGEITDPSPADTTLWLPQKTIPPPSPTQAFPGQPSFLPLLSHSSRLPKNPERTAVPLEVLRRHSRDISASLVTLSGVSAVPPLWAPTTGTHSDRGA